jgi:hypothetical protein
MAAPEQQIKQRNTWGERQLLVGSCVNARTQDRKVGIDAPVSE